MAAKRIPPWLVVFAAWLFTIAYAFPGYMNWDSSDQIYQERIGRIFDWHPALMAWYWRVIEHVVRGPFGMLVLQTLLFAWGMYRVFSSRFSARTASIVTALLLVFPPILTPMAVVWKDAQMAGFLLAGIVLVLRPGRGARVLGVVLLVLATGVRDNGLAAIPAIALVMVATWGVRRWGARLAVALGLVIAIGGFALLANVATRDRHAFAWYRTVAIHDLAGTLCDAPPLSDAQVRELLDGIPLRKTTDLQHELCTHYDPRAWFALSFGDPMFDAVPDKHDRLARRRAWLRVVRAYPGAYLHHRLTVMGQVLGLTKNDPWEPVCQTFAATEGQLRRISHDASLSGLQTELGRWFVHSWSKTLWYRPWAYAVLGFVVLGFAIRRRDRLLFALVGSGLLYETSLLLGAAAPDYRYSHWMVTCVTISLAIVFGERLRTGRSEARRRNAT